VLKAAASNPCLQSRATLTRQLPAASSAGQLELPSQTVLSGKERKVLTNVERSRSAWHFTQQQRSSCMKNQRISFSAAAPAAAAAAAAVPACAVSAVAADAVALGLDNFVELTMSCQLVRQVLSTKFPM